MGFSKDNYGIWIQNAFFRNTILRVSFYYSQYFYNKHFTEYDCNDLTFGVRLFQPLLEDLKLECAYQYTSSDAKGYDDPGESKGNSDEADASYIENEVEGRVTWDIPPVLKLNHNFSLGCVYQYRYYTTENYLELDPLHAGRTDDIFAMSAEYEVRIKRSLKISLFYNWFMRDTDTRAMENKAYVSAEKDYRQNQVGLELLYTLKFR
jgi:outer membrane protein assembly factor BamA